MFGRARVPIISSPALSRSLSLSFCLPLLGSLSLFPLPLALFPLSLSLVRLPSRSSFLFPPFFFHFRGYFLLFSFLPTYLHSAVLSFRRLILRAAERALPSPRSNFERLRVALPCARASERAVYEDQDAPLVGLLYVFSIVGEERRRRRRRRCRRARRNTNSDGCSLPRYISNDGFLILV